MEMMQDTASRDQNYSAYVKRAFDFVASLCSLLLFSWFFLLLVLVLRIVFRGPVFFLQTRIGKDALPFRIIKFRTMEVNTGKIDALGRFLRKSKLDELPQLINVLKGDMSFVGPRPDVPGYYDCLKGEDRKILRLRPGITGPASLKYANEEVLLATKENPLRYNDDVIFPDKISINLEYLQKQSFWLDCKILFYTIFGKKNDRYLE